MKNYIVESVFEHEGILCVVILSSIGHRCGYIGLPKNSPLHGVEYGDKIDSKEALVELKQAEIGKRGIIPIFCWDGESVTPDVLFNVHGGVTYSGGSDGYPVDHDGAWFFGFDCAHAGDAKDWDSIEKNFEGDQWKVSRDIDMEYPTGGTIRTKEYVEQECKNLCEQVKCVSELMK